ncbi:MAG: DUF2891 domain-containing protein, partial [Gemmatimonadota bacterium]|nr:DUF2891 domain-containing protein [Gemmatimonadota bacterium]
MEILTQDYASRLAAIALSHVTREYPNKLDHVLTSRDDAKGPRELHPIFYGSFDWHSCVHGYWLLARVLRKFPNSGEAARIRDLFNAQFTAEKVAVESAYAAASTNAGFERPYGWAWLLMLTAELARTASDDARRWFGALAPLAEIFANRFLSFLPKATYPIRTGTHYNTAFSLVLAGEYAVTVNNETLNAAFKAAALRWYLRDAAAPAWEPGGDEFLSPTLIEAVCMQRFLSAADFSGWMHTFLPRLLERQPATLFEPATVSDRSDGKIAHLDGLNLSRAWCWRLLAASWPAGDLRRHQSLQTAALHLDASLSHVSGDYM